MTTVKMLYASSPLSRSLVELLVLGEGGQERILAAARKRWRCLARNPVAKASRRSDGARSTSVARRRRCMVNRLQDSERGRRAPRLAEKLIDGMMHLGGWKGELPFLGGNNVKYADVVVAAKLKWSEVVINKSQWDRVRGAIAGVWGGGPFLEASSSWNVIPA
ncbi:hypothetical protein BV25DRAFT_1659240 [Artomyces pyxidatus]|uniref:Uncharacterized protein n=1 Tax=Artomyces pyxidatus TaxID=48021 RepID=A0ACB8SJC9_9AGAM|nr:hypothetical protein BV25DRAFT_1659240 [Artomyces pyxidatus]